MFCCNLRPFAGEDVDEEIGEACEKEREKEGKEELANVAAQDCTIGAKEDTENVERKPQWFYQAITMIFVCVRCFQSFCRRFPVIARGEKFTLSPKKTHSKISVLRQHFQLDYIPRISFVASPARLYRIVGSNFSNDDCCESLQLPAAEVAAYKQG